MQLDEYFLDKVSPLKISKNELKIFKKKFQDSESLNLLLKLEALLFKIFPYMNEEERKYKLFYCLLLVENHLILRKVISLLTKNEIKELNNLRNEFVKIGNPKICLNNVDNNGNCGDKGFLDQFNYIIKDQKNLDVTVKLLPLGDIFYKTQEGYDITIDNIFKEVVIDSKICINCKIKVIKDLNFYINKLYNFNNLNYLIIIKNLNSIVEFKPFHAWKDKIFIKGKGNKEIKGKVNIKSLLERLSKNLPLIKNENPRRVIVESLIFEDINNLKISITKDIYYIKEKDINLIRRRIENILIKYEITNFDLESLLKPYSLTSIIEKHFKPLQIQIKDLNFLEKADLAKDKQFISQLELIFKDLELIDKKKTEDIVNKSKMKFESTKHESLIKNTIYKRNYYQNIKKISKNKLKKMEEGYLNFYDKCETFFGSENWFRFKSGVTLIIISYLYFKITQIIWTDEPLYEEIIKNIEFNKNLKDSNAVSTNVNIPKIFKRNYHINYKLRNLYDNRNSFEAAFLNQKIIEKPDIYNLSKKSTEYIYNNSPEIIKPLKKFCKEGKEIAEIKSKETLDAFIKTKDLYKKTGFNPKEIVEKKVGINTRDLKFTTHQQLRLNEILDEVKKESLLEQKKILNEKVQKKVLASAKKNISKQIVNNNTLNETKIIQKSLLYNLWELYFFNIFEYALFYIKATGSLIKANFSYYLTYARMCITRRFAFITWPPILEIISEKFNFLLGYLNEFLIYIKNNLLIILEIFNSLHLFWQILISCIIIYFIFKFIKNIWFIITLPLKLMKKCYKFLFNYENLADQRKNIEIKNELLIKNLLEKEKKRKKIGLENKIFKRNYYVNYKLQSPKTLGNWGGNQNPFIEYFKKYLGEKWKDPNMQVSFFRKVLAYAHPTLFWRLIKGTTLDKVQAFASSTGRIALGFGLNIFIKRAIQAGVMCGFTALNFFYPSLSLVKPLVDATVPYISDVFTVMSLGQIEAWKDWYFPKGLRLSNTINEKVRELLINKNNLPALEEKLPGHWNKPIIGTNTGINLDTLNQMQPELPPLDNGNLTEFEKGQIKSHEEWKVKKDSETIKITEELNNNNTTIKYIIIGTLVFVVIGLTYYYLQDVNFSYYTTELTNWLFNSNNNDCILEGGIEAPEIITNDPTPNLENKIDNQGSDEFFKQKLADAQPKEGEILYEEDSLWYKLKEWCYWLKEKFSFNTISSIESEIKVNSETELEKEFDLLQKEKIYNADNSIIDDKMEKLKESFTDLQELKRKFFEEQNIKFSKKDNINIDIENEN